MAAETAPAAPKARRASRSWSLAARLAAAYAACACALLCGVSVLSFGALRANFDREDDEFLSAHLRQGALPRDADSGATSAAAQRPGAVWSRVLDGRGRIERETPGMSALLPPSLFGSGSREVWRGERLFRLRQSPAEDGAAGRAEHLGRARVVQAALDRTDDYVLLQRYAAQMGWVLAGGFLASAGAGFVVARRGLAPVAAMERRIQAVEAERLGEHRATRLGHRSWPRELSGLAGSFDLMLDRLEGSFERLGRFSSDLAHELRTPLSNLRGEAEVALSRPRSVEELRAVLESSLEECHRLSRLVDSLLFIARAEHPATRIERRRLDARAEAEAVRLFYDALAEESGVSVACQGEASLCADADLLRRALGNLLSNALRHTERGGQVLVLLQEQGGGATVQVRDTGRGVSPEHLPRLFDRFYRADAARSDSPDDASHGTGLGLSIVQSIMHLHGGTVDIASTWGVGTTVTLFFPSD